MSVGSKVVLLACGSFNPPTYMHLRMFELARDQLQSEGVHVLGGVVSPVHDAYGKKDLVAAHHRCSMLQLAIRSSNWIRMSEWETQQEGWSRTRLVLEHHQDVVSAVVRGELTETPSWLPESLAGTDSTDNISLNDRDNNNFERAPVVADDVRVKLLCGADLLESFATPGLWSPDDLEAIVGRHGLVVISRAGGDPARFIYESDVLYSHRHNVKILTNWVHNEISSTALRRLLRRCESVKYLTDDGVAQYAIANRLYRSPLTMCRVTPASSEDVWMRPPEHAQSKRRRGLLSFTDTVSPVLDKLPGKAVQLRQEVSKVVEAGKGKLAEVLKVDTEKGQRICSRKGVNVEKSGKKVNEHVSPFATEAGKIAKVDIGKTSGKIETCKKSGNDLEKFDGRLEYRTRSCNDLVRLMLTRHGIHVISDTEAIV